MLRSEHSQAHYTQHGSATSPIEDSKLEELMAVLEEEAQNQRQQARKGLRGVMWTLGLSALIALIVCTVAAVTGNWSMTRNLAFLGFAGFAGLLGLMSLSSRRHNETARLVAACNDPRAIGPLLDSLSISDPAALREVFEAVARLLPRTSPEVLSSLTTDRIAAINRILRTYSWGAVGSDRLVGLIYLGPPGSVGNQGIRRRNVESFFGWRIKQMDFVIAAIEASPHYGNADTLKYVERFAAMNPQSEESRKAKEIATSVLPELRARVDRIQTAENLLRPAQSESDSLLRPAGHVESDEPASLLRPAANG